jgi:hypothetical protein
VAEAVVEEAEEAAAAEVGVVRERRLLPLAAVEVEVVGAVEEAAQ